MKRHETRESAVQNAAISRIVVLCALKHAASFRIFVLCALKDAAISRISVLCVFKSIVISMIFCARCTQKCPQFSKILKCKMDFSTYKRAWQSSSAAAAGALGTAHSKSVLLLGAIWQWDRTQAQTDVRGGRARG